MYIKRKETMATKLAFKLYFLSFPRNVTDKV